MVEVKADSLEQSFEAIEEEEDGVAALKAELETLKAKIASGAIAAQRPALDGVKSAEATSFVDQYLRRGIESGLETKAIGSSSGSIGGYAVPQEIDRVIDQTLTAISPIRAIANVVKVGSAGYRKLIASGGTPSGWVAYEAARPETNTPAFSEIVPASGELYANPAASQQMLDDLDLRRHVTTILADATGGIIGAEAPDQVIGYAAYGRSAAAAVQPLVDCFDVVLFDDGPQLRGPTSGGPTVIGIDELGSSGDSQKVTAISREYAGANAAPSTLRMSYYDPQRDYQSGEARAVSGEPGTNEVQEELPAAVSADDAKSLVQHKLAREWARRDRVTLRLPPARAALEPGMLIETDAAPGSWMVEKCSLDSFVTMVELRPAWEPRKTFEAQVGRIVAARDIVQAPTSLAVIRAPNFDTSQTGASIGIAASSANPGWRARDLSVTIGAHSFGIRTAGKKSLLGRTSSKLAADGGEVEIELIDREQWLTSCDDAALSQGVNLAVLGDEVLQFGGATPLGDGRFRLDRLVRGGAASDHSTGETFCLLSASTIRMLPIPPELVGCPITIADRYGAEISAEVRGPVSSKRTAVVCGPNRKRRADT